MTLRIVDPPPPEPAPMTLEERTKLEREAIEALMSICKRYGAQLPDESIWKSRLLRCHSNLAPHVGARHIEGAAS